MAALAARKTTPQVFRHSLAIWQPKRYLKRKKRFWFMQGPFYLFLSSENMNDGELTCLYKTFLRCLFRIGCCRFSPGFESLWRNNHKCQEPSNHRIFAIQKRTILGSIIPNPLSTSRRKKYSEKRILG